MKGKVFGINFKTDWDAVLLGVGVMYAALIIPGISGFVYDKLVVPVRTLLGPKK